MTARIKTGQSPRELNSTSALFFDKDLVSIPAERIPDEVRNLSGFVPVVILIPKSAVQEKTTSNGLTLNKSVIVINAGRIVPRLWRRRHCSKVRAPQTFLCLGK